MATIRDTCPICGGPIKIVEVQCQSCQAVIQANPDVLGIRQNDETNQQSESIPDIARFGALGRLSREQLAFIETFIRARGIIKTVEGMLGISYPTVRSRLDDIIASMGLSPADEPAGGINRREQRDILQDLADGTISPQDAHILLRKISSEAGDGGRRPEKSPGV